MGEWREVALGDLVRETGGSIKTGPFGSQLHASDYTGDPDGIPVVMPSDMDGGRIVTSAVKRVSTETAARLAAHRLSPGDIVMARRGDIGRLAHVAPAEDGWLCGTGSIRVSAPGRRSVDTRFLRYALSAPSVTEWLLGRAVGATMKNLNAEIVGDLRVRIPTETGNQRRVAGVLSAFDELIEINERRIALLEDIARSLYREWFVHFRFPGHEDVAMVDSERRPIPVGWKVLRLREVAAIVMGQAPRSEEVTTQPLGLPFHQGVGTFGPLVPTTTRFTESEKRVAEAGSVLCSVRAPVGRLNVTDQRVAIGRGLAAIRRNDGAQGLLALQLRHALGEEDELGGGTIFKAINKGELSSLLVLEAPQELATAAAAITEPVLAERIHLTKQSTSLARTRDFLLPRLVTGRLDISEIDLGVLTPAEV